MSRTFAYAIHRKKLILVGKWPYATKDENCENIIVDKTYTSLISGTIARTPDVCCGPPSSPPAHGGCITCTADDPSCVPSPPSSDSIDIIRRDPILQISPCACTGMTSASQHVPECVQHGTVHYTDSGGCAGVVCGLNSDEAYGEAGDSSPAISNHSF